MDLKQAENFLQAEKRKKKRHLHNLADEVLEVIKMARHDKTYIKKIIHDNQTGTPSMILYHDHMIQGYSFEMNVVVHSELWDHTKSMVTFNSRLFIAALKIRNSTFSPSECNID